MRDRQQTPRTPLPPIRRHNKIYRLGATGIGCVANLLFFLKDKIPIKHHARTRVVLMNKKASHILLVRNISPPLTWKLPGGGYHDEETAYQCAARELKEELGIPINPSDLRLLPDALSPKNTRHYLVTRIKEPALQLRLSLELIDADWFPLESLPSRCSKDTRRIVQWLLSSM